MKNKRNIYKEVTEMIVKTLKKGVGPWVRPYDVPGGPERNINGSLYRGINILLLWMKRFKKGYITPVWLTYRQAKKLGGHVRPGETGTHVIYWDTLVLRVKEQCSVCKYSGDGCCYKGNDTWRTENAEKREKCPDWERKEPKIRRTFPFAKFYVVFNVEQCEGITLPPSQEWNWEGDSWEGNALLRKLYALPEIRKGIVPAYIPFQDYIEMPPKKAFKSPEDYWGTFLHELTHWTGHESRCDRQLNSRFGDDAYAMEEMVAEMGAAFLGAFAGLPIRKLQHPEYIQHWLKVLEKDYKAIFTAARRAQEACDWLLGRAGLAEKELKKAA